jgi:hypothetical protein
MEKQNAAPLKLSRDDLRILARTVTDAPVKSPQLPQRLEFIAELLGDAGRLPSEPVLAWRGSDGVVKHAPIGTKLVVGRRADGGVLSFPGDKLMSGAHFEICGAGDGCELRDLNSRNGTAVNDPVHRVTHKVLCDGDLILAGNHIFAFLDQSRTA